MSNSRGKGRATNTAPRKRFTAVTVTVAVVVVLFIAALIINSSFIRREVTAAEANGMKFTAAEYQYFYVSAISDYTTEINNTFGEYASSMLPDTSISYEAQTVPGSDQTWAQYYDELAHEKLQFYSGAYQEATASGFSVSDEDYALIDADIDALAEMVTSYYNMTLKEYLDNQFGAGSGMNEKLYRELTKKQHYVTEYSKHIYNGYSYSETELDSYYEEHSDEFDVFKYRFFTVRAETLNEDDFASTEEYEAADKAAVEAARELAAEYVATISSEQDFIEKAREYDGTTYEKDTSTLYHTSGDSMVYNFEEWLKEPDRSKGDLHTQATNEDESANRAFYVVYFIERLKNEYPTADVELMVISGETVSSDDYLDDNGEVYEEAYNNAVEDQKTALEAKAKEIFAEWETEGGTREFLTDYYAEKTTVPYGDLDAYSATLSGSFYERIYYSYTEGDAADEWMHDPSRKEGDFTVVSYSDSAWYFLYFAGRNMDHNDSLADTGLRGEAYTAWEDAFKATEVKTRWGLKLL